MPPCGLFKLPPNASDELKAQGGYKYPDHQTPWQEIQRSLVDQFDKGMGLKPAVKYRDVARQNLPRDNH